MSDRTTAPATDPTTARAFPRPPGPAHIVLHSAANALADLRAVYTWKTWTFGWLGRMLAQVTFFALVATMLDRPGALTYLVLGNAVMTCVVESMMVVASSSWERFLGTMSLLSASPARLVWVFFGRSLQWPLSGAGTSLVALFALGPAFGVHWQAGKTPAVVLLVLLTALGSYCFGLFLAAVVVNLPGLRNIVSNSAYLLMMAVCGVQVPVSFWPQWVGVLAWPLPLTHTLSAVRELAGAGRMGITLTESGLALLVSAGWFAAAYLTFRRQETRGRRTGALYLT
ncbi:ABC transporter permease [Streptomyces sp. NPDC050617]|uniref:ABC transporter permease n=1 Tax=Streptomyces sp. NPDC050617 TaxID=3154628 RepID=UPI00343AC15A